MNKGCIYRCKYFKRCLHYYKLHDSMVELAITNCIFSYTLKIIVTNNEI